MASNIKIEWLTKSLAMYNAFVSEKSVAHVRGGRVYELLAIDVLKKNYEVAINKALIKTTNTINYIFQNHKSKINGDICVIDPYLLALGKFNGKKKNIAIVHHIDEDIFNKNLMSKIFYFNLKRNLKKMNAVVVVSEVWKTTLTNIGVNNVKVIYNAFDIKDYEFSYDEKEIFKKKYHLEGIKPVVYIGPNSPGKGISEILEVIDQDKYNLVATGKVDVSNKNVKTFFFSEEEFPLFLACCDVVLCMSTMTEGWNRIAHEALLSKTPVIGSGTGGMLELLENADQIMVKDINELDKHIARSIENTDQYTTAGHKYASKFDLNYFKSSWNALIEELA
ncbi:glycosyltransferase involved in cell wall biosynthesis [Winogradskyella eximia]|uniref:Glycosyltransferase involved in cell wall biosynthesis n=1 Tax=Winogradskyella eximia TaxID=262006 RepID=A0A3D9HC73_9FLAO|nr:glycosyltransferase [Winogradskyella eximia]RED47069.1 glycosyltransferase involved in cell wall biosynthesis [Winogradskyella eximia]